MSKFARSSALLAVAALFLFGQVEPVQASVASCSDRFSDATLDIIQTGPVTIETTGIPPGLADRFRDEITLVA